MEGSGSKGLGVLWAKGSGSKGLGGWVFWV